ncbi:hypothetical protein [Dipodfec virus UOA04_Rod_386]|nr:hypothetical protein [Dipodfec virus UOA04_Rod_386]
MLVFISAIPCGTETSDYFLVSFRVKQDAPAVEQIYTSVSDATTAVTKFFNMTVEERFKFCQDLFERDLPKSKNPCESNPS